MADQEFEWDDAKRPFDDQETWNRFEDAKLIFDGVPVLHAPSSQKGEERWIAVGSLEGLIISVIYTFRDGKIRLITAPPGQQTGTGALR